MILKTVNGKVFGAFYTAKLSKSRAWVEDSKSFVFSMTNLKKFKNSATPG